MCNFLLVRVGLCLSWRRNKNKKEMYIFSYICISCLPSCMVNKYYYIQRRGVTLKFNRSRSLKMGPIDRSYSRACVTITSSGVCFVSKQLASTSFCWQVLRTLLVRRWRGSSGNVRLSNLLISSCRFSEHVLVYTAVLAISCGTYGSNNYCSMYIARCMFILQKFHAFFV